MEKISEAIVSKVRAEAQNIVKEAEERALGEIEKAKKQWEIRLEEEKRKMLEEAEGEAARIAAQASVRARQELLRAKADVVAKMIDRVKLTLSGMSSDERLSLSLIKEAMDGLSADKGRIYVSPKDVSTAQKLLERDEKLASKIMEVRAVSCTGGVIAEDIEGTFRIENTYETRLEMLLPRVLPEVSKELFEAS